ncbi:hypothetical protein L494_1525 [Bordetella bronchiseptica CA90 BB1334]|nr:hypothetical protein L494_1525 [Bordetella bronchiseptica CA90 BB1334]KDD41907.1 hypothetical protein L532_1552 [Bordetella bronchiseptica OSU095]
MNIALSWCLRCGARSLINVKDGAANAHSNRYRNYPNFNEPNAHPKGHAARSARQATFWPLK